MTDKEKKRPKNGDGLELRGQVWYARYELPPGPDGKRRWRKVPCRHEDGRPMSRSEAKIHRATIIADLARGTRIEPARLTLSAHLEDWLERKRSAGRSPATIASYDTNIRLHINPMIGNYQLSKLRPVHIQYFYDELLTAKLSAKTIRNIHCVVRGALDHAYRLELIPSNPADKVELPSYIRPKPTIADEPQLAKIQAAIADSKYRICVLLATCAGLRRGEIVALKWWDFDEAQGTLLVCRAAIKVKGGVVVKTTKSGHERALRLPITMVEELTRHKAEQAAAKLRYSGTYHDEGWINCNEDGTMFTPSGLASEYYRLKKKLGFDVNLHGLRHTFVTEQLAAGTPSEIVQKMSGHATMAFMHDVYGHAQARHQEAAMTVSEKLLHPKPQIKVVE